jgi:hypothetical protein
MSLLGTLAPLMMNSSIIASPEDMMGSGSAAVVAPAWMVDFVEFRKRLFLRTVEPVILTLLGPLEEEKNISTAAAIYVYDESHRRLGFMPSYVEDASAFRETSMSFATLMMLFVIMSCILLIFLSCFYHNQKTSPLFISPRRHRLPKLVPPPLPIDGYFDWVRKRERQRPFRCI